MEIKLRPMSKKEQLYAYTQSHEISMKTGYCGYVRGDFGKSGEEYHSTLFKFEARSEDDECVSVLDELIEALQTDKLLCKPLMSRNNMRACCAYQRKAIMQGNYGEEWGFRVDTDKYAFLIRFEPYLEGDYDFYIFQYDRKWLDNQIQHASKGIRFITSQYKTLFTLEDGDNIKINYFDGTSDIKNCRFIDEYHVEINRNIYHICQFAEIMERNGNTVIPFRRALPEKAYMYNPERKTIVTITKGESETTSEPAPSEYDFMNKAYVEDMNDKEGLNKQQVAAMIAGAEHGWRHKAADPRNYDDSGRLLKSVKNQDRER